MRTRIHWAMKSQQPIAMTLKTERRIKIGSKSLWSWNDSVLICHCATDKKIDIFTDRIVTYLKYGNY